MIWQNRSLLTNKSIDKFSKSIHALTAIQRDKDLQYLVFLACLLLGDPNGALVALQVLNTCDIRLQLGVDRHINTDATGPACQQREAHEDIRGGEFGTTQVVATRSRQLLLKELEIHLDVRKEEHCLHLADDAARDGLYVERNLVTVTEHLRGDG